MIAVKTVILKFLIYTTQRKCSCEYSGRRMDCPTLLKLAAHSSGTRKPRLIKYLWFQAILIGWSCSCCIRKLTTTLYIGWSCRYGKLTTTLYIGWSCRYGKLTTTLCVGQNISIDLVNIL